MLKHFKRTITETGLSFERDQTKIEAEECLDGFYVVRARNVSQEEMNQEQVVESYKSLSQVERVFRTMKMISLKASPIYHRDEDMVRAHLFICMLACYVQWNMERKLAPILFRDEELAEQKNKRTNPVEAVERSESAKKKAASKQTTEGLPVHSFSSLLKDLAGVCLVRCRPLIEGAEEFIKRPQLSALQQEAFNLLEIRCVQ